MNKFLFIFNQILLKFNIFFYFNPLASRGHDTEGQNLKLQTDVTINLMCFFKKLLNKKMSFEKSSMFEIDFRQKKNNFWLNSQFFWLVLSIFCKIVTKYWFHLNQFGQYYHFGVTVSVKSSHAYRQQLKLTEMIGGRLDSVQSARFGSIGSMRFNRLNAVQSAQASSIGLKTICF